MPGSRGSTRRHRRAWVISFACALSLLFGGVAAASYHNSITPRGIIIHHSAVYTTREGRAVDLAALDDYHRQRGFGIFYWGKVYHVGYHYIIFPDGRVEQGRPERCLGAHATGHNSDIGICLVGDFSSPDNPDGRRGPPEPTREQLRALVGLTRRLRAQYQIPLENVRRHHDVNDGTECPGDHFPFQSFLEQIGDR